MKSHPSGASSILPVLILLVASGLTGTAQQPTTTRQQPTAQQEKPLIPEPAELRELNPEALRIAVPRECMGIRPDVQAHDVADTFNPPGAPLTLSSALAAYLSGKPVKGYDDKRVNMIFADSFKLRNCRVCYATLEVGVRHDQDLWTNDTITVGAAPFTASPGTYFIYSGIWSPPTPNPKTLTFALPTAALNSYLFSTSTVPTSLDVVAQDDTNFDYAKLSVWYY
jgi:hypothetical protein